MFGKLRALKQLREFKRDSVLLQDIDPLVDGLAEGTDGILDVLITLFPFVILIGILGLIFAVMKFRTTR